MSVLTDWWELESVLFHGSTLFWCVERGGGGSWAGKLLPRGFLWFDLAIKSYYPLLNCLFLGRLCGNLKCQPQFFPMDDGIGSYFN